MKIPIKKLIEARKTTALKAGKDTTVYFPINE